MRKTTYIQAINEAMKEELRRDKNVFLSGKTSVAMAGFFGSLVIFTKNLGRIG